MIKYIFKRLLGIIPTVFVIITFCFFLIRLAPGGPFDTERDLPDYIKANLEAKYNLDKPLYQQYFLYLWGIARGDLGPSMLYDDHDVAYYIGISLPNSLLLGLLAMLFSFSLGVALGILAAIRQNSLLDYSAMGIAVVGISVPVFVVGPLFQYFFGMKLHFLPISGWLGGRWGVLVLILPTLTLAIRYMANFARITRGSVLEIIRSDYIRTARAKGLSSQAIIFKHVLKGALLPTISYFGPAFAAIVTGSVVIEQIFFIPGLGRFFIQSAFNRDYTLLLGVVIVYALLLILMNFIVDIVYAFLDPRISYH